jgi:uncharacterized protein (TIGR02611 family)
LATTYRHARRIVIFIVGCAMLITGLAMLVLPGPAILVIPAGLGVLSLEFAWARRWLHHLRDRFATTTRPTPVPDLGPETSERSDTSDVKNLKA